MKKYMYLYSFLLFILLFLSCRSNNSILTVDDYQNSQMYPTLSYYDGYELDPSLFSMEYRKTPDNQYAKDAITLINKWHVDLYKNFKYYPIYFHAIARELENDEIYNRLKHIKILDNLHKDVFIIDEITHTQMLERFKKYPGRDPWGPLSSNKEIPTYKKLLPSEMMSMSRFTGKITGKCMTIAALILGLLKKEGISSDDIMLFRLPGHVIGIFRYNNAFYIINNNEISLMNEMIKIENDSKEEIPFNGFYNDNYYYKGDFIFNTPFIPDQSLVDYMNIEFADTINTINKDILNNLIPYAYQSLEVPDPDLYLKASALGPLIKELSTSFKTGIEFLHWIHGAIKQGSIFPDYMSRIMTADQVIVFRTGSYKDQAMTLASFLVIKMKDPIITITKDNAYVTDRQEIFDVKNRCIINTLPSEKCYTIKYK